MFFPLAILRNPCDEAVSMLTETATRGFLKNLAIFTGKHLCWSLFLIKLHLQICYLTHAFSCEICEIVKKTFFHRTPPVVAASVVY